MKMLKKNKKFYYRTGNFISVSNLMFRMKHNAAGLASICVLSTGVILLLTCASSLMMLGEQNIETQFPKDIVVKSYRSEQEAEENYLEAVEQAAGHAGIVRDSILYMQFKRTSETREGNRIFALTEENRYDYTGWREAYFLSLNDYNRYAGTQITLNADEILLYSNSDFMEETDTLQVFDTEFQVNGKVDYDKILYVIDPTMGLFEKDIIVCADEQVVNRLLEKDPFYENAGNYEIFMGFDVKEELSEKQIKTFRNDIKKAGLSAEVRYDMEDRAFFYSLYGGVFYVGIFLAVLFLMATVMLLFFLPVGTAVMHMLVAGNIVRTFLKVILIVDAVTFYKSIAVVCVLFLLVYALVYKITSIRYYNIVRKQ